MSRENRMPAPSRLLARLLPLVFALVASFTAAEERFDRSVIGQWRITSVLDFAAISALDDKEAQHLVGKVFVITRHKVQFDKRVCTASDFRVERVERDRNLRENARVQGTTLGLPNPVNIIELSCAYLYMKTRDRAVLAWEGVYFDAVRIKK